MTQVVEDYLKKRISEQISIHDKEIVKVLLQNGASVDLIKKIISIFFSGIYRKTEPAAFSR